jgi:hypothetical protein
VAVPVGAGFVQTATTQRHRIIGQLIVVRIRPNFNEKYQWLKMLANKKYQP